MVVAASATVVAVSVATSCAYEAAGRINDNAKYLYLFMVVMIFCYSMRMKFPSISYKVVAPLESLTVMDCCVYPINRPPMCDI